MDSPGALVRYGIASFLTKEDAEVDGRGINLGVPERFGGCRLELVVEYSDGLLIVPRGTIVLLLVLCFGGHCRRRYSLMEP